VLTEEEKHEIEEEFKLYPYKSAAAIEALKVVQKHRRWISDESIKDIAELLDITPDELDSVATFYNMIYRKPVGRNVIHICNSVSCWVMGYESILKHLSERLGITYGQTSADGRFTLLPVQCLGTCDHAPALLINGDLHRDLTPDKINSILEKYQ
jgi:NADH-quinone oxidoreductase subunit E